MRTTITTILAIIMFNLPAFAQVVEYDVPYESKWEQPVATEKECRVFGVFPCHEGFTYDEPEGNNPKAVTKVTVYEDKIPTEPTCKPKDGGNGKKK